MDVRNSRCGLTWEGPASYKATQIEELQVAKDRAPGQDAWPQHLSARLALADPHWKPPASREHDAPLHRIPSPGPRDSGPLDQGLV